MPCLFSIEASTPLRFQPLLTEEATAVAGSGMPAETCCIVIASADGDLAALLGARVAWLQILQRPSPSQPAPWRLVSAAGFEREHGLPAHALPEFHALTGGPCLPDAVVRRCCHMTGRD